MLIIIILHEDEEESGTSNVFGLGDLLFQRML